MPYVLDSTIEPKYSKSIYGFRTGSGGGKRLPLNADTCDLSYTLRNPFEFRIDWRLRYVKVRKPFKTRKGKTYYRTKRVSVPYPFYQFDKQRRTVREWRMIYRAGMKVVADYPEDYSTPQVIKHLNYLKKFLDRRGTCKAMFKAPQVQHSCLLQESSFNGSYPERVHPVLSGNGITVDFGYNTSFAHTGTDYRFWQPLTIDYTGETFNALDNTVQSQFKQQLTAKLLRDPRDVTFSDNTISTVTAMLWPDSGDFEDIGASPLIDLSEAAADGVFPLGPPPDAAAAHDRIMDNAIDHDTLMNLNSAKDAIDFAANMWLWRALVLEPVMSSAAGLMASVKANDLAIESYNEIAMADKWIKGKSLRLFKGDTIVGCSDVDLTYSESQSYDQYGYVYYDDSFSADVEVKKADANAMFIYRLSWEDSIKMQGSAMRISQYLNRLSSGFDDVLHNLIPLSFVADWFTSSYTGILDLKNKIYMPVAEHKLIVSYNLDAYVSCSGSSEYRASFHDEYRSYPITGRLDTGYPTGTKRASTLRPVSHWHSYPYYWNKPIEHPVYTLKYNWTERIKYYDRRVYDNPTRRTDFSSDSLGIDCFDYINPDPLNMGKATTLGALIWGFLPGT